MDEVKPEQPEEVKKVKEAKKPARAVRNTARRASEDVKALSDDSKSTPEGYAEKNAEHLGKTAAKDTAKTAKAAVRKTYEGGKKLVEKHKSEKAAEDTGEKAVSSAVNNAPKTLERTVKTKEYTVKGTEKAVKTAEKTAEQAAKSAEKAAKTAKVSAETARDTAAAAYKTAEAAAKATASAIKAITAAAEETSAAIAAGGGVSAIIIILICTVALIAGSCFGIFFSGEDTGTGMTIRTAISELNREYEDKISAIRYGTAYDVLEMRGARAVWPEVLSVYAVKTASDPDDPEEVASMDEHKLELLRKIFWEMNSVSSSTESRLVDVLDEKDDGRGNIISTVSQATRRYLYITVSHKSVSEMAAQYNFNATQRQELTELLADDKQKLWSGVLYGISSGDDSIVAVALSQLGNVGGQPYWSWYGFGSRVPWCACFVSWCANECGYIETGIIPKFASCSYGVSWFQERGQWQDGSYIPNTGDLIFFDWSPRDGSVDHVGIVEKVENGYVYTVEGNTTNSCAKRCYSVGHYEIYGYGLPAY